MSSDSSTSWSTSSCNDISRWSVSALDQTTYVAQVVDDVEKELGLLIVIARLFNSLLADEILGDFGPHFLLGLRLTFFLLLAFRKSANTKFGGVNLVVGVKLTSPDAIIPLPCDFLVSTAKAFHVDTFGAGRDIDNGPILGGAIVAFAHEGSFGDLSVVIFSLGSDIVLVATTTRCRYGASTRDFQFPLASRTSF